MTNGEKWLARAVARISGWCKTRGWQHGEARQISPGIRFAQFEVWVSDASGNEAAFAFEMRADVPLALDDAGRDRDFDAVTFESMVPLRPRAKPCKRQLAFAF